MKGINKVTLLGNIGEKPIIRQTQGGEKVANFSLATGETWKDRQTGERREKTEWHRVVAWGSLAGIVEQYCQKSSRIHVSGKLATSKYMDGDGIERYITQIVIDDLLLLNPPPNAASSASATTQPQEPSAPDPAPSNFEDDDIPF